MTDKELAHQLDMCAFEASKLSIAVSDMLSDLAQAVKDGDRDLDGFKERWLKWPITRGAGTASTTA